MKHCCCCISLRAGTVTMGVLSLISSIAGIIVIVPAIASSRVISQQPIPSHFPSDPYESVIAYDHVNEVASSDEVLFYIFYVVVLVYMVVTGLTSALMIYGAIRRVSQCVFPWLALNFASNVYVTCAMVVTIIVIAISQSESIYLSALVGTALGTGLNFFLWLAVFSYYQELVGEESQNRIHPNIGKVISPPPMYFTHNP